MLVLARDVPAFQTARNRQYKQASFTYSRVCPGCSGYNYSSNNFPKATGNVSLVMTSYKILDQNNRYDFFLVDVTATIGNRKGDEDWGWMNFDIRSTGTVKVLSSSYSLGKDVRNTTTCKSYPVDLGVGFYGVSAGTTVGHVKFCNPGSKVASSSITRGRHYHATGISGIAQLQMQRYVRVANGKLPSFSITAERNVDSSNCATWSDGYHCWVNHGTRTSKWSIGTSRQS